MSTPKRTRRDVADTLYLTGADTYRGWSVEIGEYEGEDNWTAYRGSGCMEAPTIDDILYMIDQRA